MRIIFDEEDAILAAKAMAISRRLNCDFDKPWAAGSTEDEIHKEALRVIAVFRDKYGS